MHDTLQYCDTVINDKLKILMDFHATVVAISSLHC